MNFINQLPIFLLGCYLHSVLDNKPKIIEITFLIAWALFAWIVNEYKRLDDFYFLYKYLTMFIFIYLCINAKLKFSIFESLGKNSYGIYLIHFLVIFYLKKIPVEHNFLTTFFAIFLTALISHLLALLIFKLTEKRIRSFVEFHLLRNFAK